MLNGERKTRYFHTTVNKRRIKRRIQQIKDTQGNKTMEENEIRTCAEDYFRKLHLAPHETENYLQ